MAMLLKSGFGVGDVDFTKLMDTVYKISKGFHACSLTNYDNTSVPALSAGSHIEIDGAVYSSDTETSIGGSPSDGDVYIKTIPAGATATLEFTNTAPVWDPVKQGWYSPTGGEESYRYLEFKIVKASASYSKYPLPRFSSISKYFCTAQTYNNGVGSSTVKQDLAAKTDPYSLIDVANKNIIIPRTGYYSVTFNNSVYTGNNTGKADIYKDGVSQGQIISNAAYSTLRVGGYDYIAHMSVTLSLYFLKDSLISFYSYSNGSFMSGGFATIQEI